jgi:23S rRNA pseudouridine1911/1915/1917 synthase
MKPKKTSERDAAPARRAKSTAPDEQVVSPSLNDPQKPGEQEERVELDELDEWIEEVAPEKPLADAETDQTPQMPSQLVLGQTLPQERLDRHLSELLPDVSRVMIRRLMDEGKIQVNGKNAKPSQSPKASDIVTFEWPAPVQSEWIPESIPLNILFEDDDLLVLNKPADRVVHPGAGHATGTLVHALLHHCKGQLSGIGGVERPGIVHRLDLGTSGCLVVAKNDFAHIKLSEQFQARTVIKTYQCLVCGDLQPPEGDIRTGIARNPSHRKRMAVVEGGRPARTTYRRLKRLNEATLVEAQLHTGRTHQIRVHFAHIGYPLVGDETYGTRASNRFRQRTGVVPPRQMLHAFRLEFEHPRTGKRQAFTAPLPPDFTEVVEVVERVMKGQST